MLTVASLEDSPGAARCEHFQHGAGIGIRGIGATRSQAFEQAALALTAMVTKPIRVRSLTAIDIRCDGADDEFLFLDWINALVVEMSARSMLFSRFRVMLDEATLCATAWGEPVDFRRHRPAVELEGATFTRPAVRRIGDGIWIAQCAVDV